MNMRDITKAALELDLSEKSGVESIYYDEIEPSRVEMVLKEPEVFLKASGIKVSEDAQIQVSALSKNRVSKPGKSVRVVVIVIVFGPVVIVIVIF